MRILNREDAIAAALGGTVLGGGGGGSRSAGEANGIIAVEEGSVQLYSIEEMQDDDIVLTVSGVGAPAAKESYVSIDDYVTTIILFQEKFNQKVKGIITNECGGNATLNGWIQAARLHLALVDAPCNGRAHPTGIMGSMSLQKQENFISQQVAVGGNPKHNRRVKVMVEGALTNSAALIRQASIVAGGAVAVARNPLPVRYIRNHAALGAITQSIELGKKMMAAKCAGVSMPDAAAEYLNGKILASGVVKKLVIETVNGFDVGHVEISTSQGLFEVSFWNEYMTLELAGTRVGTFPDLIMTFNSDTGEPVTTAEIEVEMKIDVLHVAKEFLILGSAMNDRELYDALETAVHKEIIKYHFR